MPLLVHVVYGSKIHLTLSDWLCEPSYPLDQSETRITPRVSSDNQSENRIVARGWIDRLKIVLDCHVGLVWSAIFSGESQIIFIIIWGFIGLIDVLIGFLFSLFLGMFFFNFLLVFRSRVRGLKSWLKTACNLHARFISKCSQEAMATEILQTVYSLYKFGIRRRVMTVQIAASC